MGTEEYYFQQSLIFNQEMLDSLVVLWYFKELNFEPFFLDWGACEYLSTGISNVIRKCIERSKEDS
ncbi:UNVERIFIED_ORG: hypothetical protein [Escherichia phage CMSTMSU]